jgi:hypothetical protein
MHWALHPTGARTACPHGQTCSPALLPPRLQISIGLENTPDDVYWRSKSLVKAVAKQAGVAEKDLYYYAVSPDTSATGVPMTRVSQ